MTADYTPRLEYDASCEPRTPEPFSLEETVMMGDDSPKYTARDMLQAVAKERERIVSMQADGLAGLIRADESKRRANLQAMLREVGKWDFRGRSVAEQYDVLHGAGSWRRALRDWQASVATYPLT